MATTTANGYTRGEELAHVATHGLGIVLSIAAIVALLSYAAANGAGAWRASGGVIFGASALLLFSTSVLYHASTSPALKPRLRLLDHAAIYVLIAGTYTPFALGVLGGAWGWTLFGLVWALAAVGVTMKTLDRLRPPWLSTGLYLLMGWLALIAAVPLYQRMPADGLLLLVGGGLAYTAGVAFFATDSRVKYGHFIWHLFVVAGSSCHFLAVLWYAQ